MAVALDAQLACASHFRFVTLEGAERAVRYHTARFRSGAMLCTKCERGMVFRAWKCDANGARHIHTGHSWRPD